MFPHHGNPVTGSCHTKCFPHCWPLCEGNPLSGPKWWVLPFYLLLTWTSWRANSPIVVILEGFIWCQPNGNIRMAWCHDCPSICLMLAAWGWYWSSSSILQHSDRKIAYRRCMNGFQTFYSSFSLCLWLAGWPLCSAGTRRYTWISQLVLLNTAHPPRWHGTGFLQRLCTTVKKN